MKKDDLTHRIYFFAPLPPEAVITASKKEGKRDLREE
jgi:hypothetical protein